MEIDVEWGVTGVVVSSGREILETDKSPAGCRRDSPQIRRNQLTKAAIIIYQNTPI